MADRAIVAIFCTLTQTLDLARAAGAFGAAFLAGAVNSVAGGGTLISFPVLIWLGLDSVTANATSTVAIWPGTVGSAWGYRREMKRVERRFFAMMAPSLAGGLLGALLLRWTPSSLFDRLVPYLILFATVLFMAQEPVQRALKTGDPETRRSAKWFAGGMLFQFAVGLYGGYFGAGIGILMLAALSILGLKDIHEMNSLKVVLGGMHFMDSYNYDVERVKRCVIHYAAPNGRIYPFCAYNSGPVFREQVERECSVPLELPKHRRGVRESELV
jgi:uncharacterized membrane protein YfcA